MNDDQREAALRRIPQAVREEWSEHVYDRVYAYMNDQ